MIMQRINYAEIIFIPLLAVFIPWLTGFTNYSALSFGEVLSLVAYFIVLSYCIWRGCKLLIDTFPVSDYSPAFYLRKIVALTLSVVAYGLVVSTALCAGRSYFFYKDFDWNVFYKTSVLLTSVLVIITLFYQVFYLLQKREQDTKKVNMLDSALSHAESAVLKNELDPHFIFNSLNALSYLIENDQEKAVVFNKRLAFVYKYFLMSKHKKFVPLEDEIEFIHNYFYLLRIRHDEKVKLGIHIPAEKYSTVIVLPCALQILVENAIKHNSFSDANPLCIKITIDENFIYVKNKISRTKTINDSTKIGLSNLRARYKMISNEAVTVEESKEFFIVRLPLLKTA